MYELGLYHIVEYIQEANLEKKEWSKTIRTAKNKYIEEVAKTDGNTWRNEEPDWEERKIDSGEEL